MHFPDRARKSNEPASGGASRRHMLLFIHDCVTKSSTLFRDTSSSNTQYAKHSITSLHLVHLLQQTPDLFHHTIPLNEIPITLGPKFLDLDFILCNLCFSYDHSHRHAALLRQCKLFRVMSRFGFILEFSLPLVHKVSLKTQMSTQSRDICIARKYLYSCIP